MADVYTRIGYIKGATGATGAQGAKGDTGDAATIQVGSVTTVPYGQTANVVNSGTEQAAVLDFTIPQGRPGQQTTEMDNLLLNSITTSSTSFPIPAVGETGKVLWGKVVKWFSDMSALVASKLNAANVVNNLTTTDSGYALDARQGKALNDALATRTTPVALQYSLANASVMSVVAGGGYAIPLAGSYVLVAFTLGITVSASRGAGTAIVRLLYNGTELTWAGSYPYQVMCVLPNNSLSHTSYLSTSPAYLMTPVALSAGDRITLNGTAILKVA